MTFHIFCVNVGNPEIILRLFVIQEKQEISNQHLIQLDIIVLFDIVAIVIQALIAAEVS